MQDKLSSSLQENILILLCFSEDHVPLIVNSVPVELFDNVEYREIASKAINYYQQFKKPVAEHLPDVLSSIIEGKDKQKAEIYEGILQDLYHSKDTVNTDFILSSIEKFIRLQNLKQGVIQVHGLLQSGDIDEAELALDSYKKQQLKVFDVGLRLSDAEKALSVFTDVVDRIPLGIPQLDEVGITPAYKELFTIAALPSKGKTQGLIHVGKIGLLARKKVVHISLEMDKKRIMKRYLMSMTATTKRNATCDLAFFETDTLGRFVDINIQKIGGFDTLEEPGIQAKLKNKISKFNSFQLVVQDFPSGQLTTQGLRVYLENLINFENFIPDMVIIDYADLMKLRTNDRIDSISRNYVDLRGLAHEYNFACVTASQMNRKGKIEKAKWLDEEHLAEDFSKMATSDVLISYNQTEKEKELGLARLLNVKNRDDVSGRKVIISQNYNACQFVVDSVLMDRSYWREVDVKEEDDGDVREGQKNIVRRKLR